jgi:hypothetical protein
MLFLLFSGAFLLLLKLFLQPGDSLLKGKIFRLQLLDVWCKQGIAPSRRLVFRFGFIIKFKADAGPFQKTIFNE